MKRECDIIKSGKLLLFKRSMSLKFYGKFAIFLQKLFKVAKPGWKVEYQKPLTHPGVYLVHHQNMFGPIHSLCLLPEDVHMWSLHSFLNKKDCFDQFYHYTLTVRKGWPKGPAYVAAKVLSWLIPKVFTSFKAFPVYHNASYLVTVRKTMKALEKGESIILCPDVDYTSTSPEIGEIYTGFLMVQKVYQQREGKPLPFIPLYASKKQKKLIVGEPIIIDAREFPENQEETIKTLRNTMNTLGYDCGDISKEVYEKVLVK